MGVGLLYKLQDTNRQSQNWIYKGQLPSCFFDTIAYSFLNFKSYAELLYNHFFSVLEEKGKKLHSMFSHDTVYTVKYDKTWYFNEKKNLLSLLFHCVRSSKHSY